MPRICFRYAAVLLVAAWTSAAVAHDPGDPLLDVAGGTTIEPRARMVDVARELLASTRGGPTAAEIVGRYSRELLLLHPAESPDKRDWMYWPAQRIGLPLNLMSAEQMTLTQELLWSLVSDYGYAKLLNIMQLENILFWTTGPGYPRGLGNYVLVFFGEPSATEPWSWRFEGHHISLSVSVTPDGVSLTPSFLGANPSNYQTSPLTGVRTLRLLEDLGKTLVNSMSAEQRVVANVQGDPAFNALSASFGIKTFEDAPFDLYGARFLLPEANWEDWKDIPISGIAGSGLTDTQKMLLARLFDQVLKVYRKQHVEKYQMEVDDLHFAFIGDPSPDGMIYYRIQGGDFFYEFGNTAAERYHVHSVWHDRKDDYGADLLRRHYELQHGDEARPAE